MALFRGDIKQLEQQALRHIYLQDQTSTFELLDGSYDMVWMIRVYKGTTLHLSLELWENVERYLTVTSKHQRLNKHQQ